MDLITNKNANRLKQKLKQMKKTELVNMIHEICDNMEVSGISAVEKINRIQVSLFVNIPGFEGTKPHKEPKLSESQKLIKALRAHHQVKDF